MVVVTGGGVVVGEPDGAIVVKLSVGVIVELSVGVVSELEAETLDDPLEDSPGERLDNAFVELPVDRIDDELVRDPIVELVSPIAVDDELMGELVSMELDDDTGKPSVPVLSGV